MQLYKLKPEQTELKYEELLLHRRDLRLNGSKFSAIYKNQ